MKVIKSNFPDTKTFNGKRYECIGEYHMITERNCECYAMRRKEYRSLYQSIRSVKNSDGEIALYGYGYLGETYFV